MKLLKKNRGNVLLAEAVNQLIADLKGANWHNQLELQKDRPDADCVHSDGFYFFDIHIHRSMLLVEFSVQGQEEEGIVSVLWAGSHDEYERVFGNNKGRIEKWLRGKGLIG